MARTRLTEEDVLNLLCQIELGLASGNSIATTFRPIDVGDYAHSINYFETDYLNISIITIY